MPYSSADASQSIVQQPRFRPHLITFVLAVLACMSSLASATAASQFHLDVKSHISECFLECHTNFTDVYNLPGRDTNGAQLITENCKYSDWLSVMPVCLAQACVSAPDAAYAAEYGVSFCAKAGVQISMELPQTYKDAAAEYFQSAAYLSTSAAMPAYRWPDFEGIILALGSVLLVVL